MTREAVITVQHLTKTFGDLVAVDDVSFERAFLSAALERHGGNISATARTLGMHRQSLQKTLRRLGISPDG